MPSWCCLKAIKIQQCNHHTGRECYPGREEHLWSCLHWAQTLNLSHGTLGNFPPLHFICTQCHTWLPSLLLLGDQPEHQFYPVLTCSTQDEFKSATASLQPPLCPSPTSPMPTPSKAGSFPHCSALTATAYAQPQSRAPSHPLSRPLQSHPQSSRAAHTAAPQASNSNTPASPLSTKMAPVHHPSAT